MSAADPAAVAERDAIRVLIVDDHRIVAEGIALALQREPGIAVVGVAGSGAEAIAIASGTAPDVVLMDYHLAEGPGITAIAAIRDTAPQTSVIVISGDADELAMLAAIEAGASGYILKTAGGAELAAQIRRAADGEMLISPESVRRLLRLSGRREASERARAEPLERMTARELEVLRLMAEGLDNAAIAGRLGISYHTVRGHVRAVLQKLDARSRLEAVARARDGGLVG